MAKSIKKNYLYNLAFQILQVLAPLITAPYIARIIGPEGNGVSSFTQSIASYFILFASVGVASYGQRQIAMERDNKRKRSKTFWELFLFKAITSLISLILYVIFIVVNGQYTVIYLILGMTILANAFDIAWFFQGMEEYKLISIRNIVIKLIGTALTFILVKTAADLPIYIGIYAVSQLVSSLLLWPEMRKYVVRVPFKSLRIFRHTKETLIYFLPQIATTIYTVVDKTMLGVITGSEAENGYYEQAYKITTLTTTLITSLNTVMTSRMSYLFGKKKDDELKVRLLKSMRFSLMLSIAFSFGIAAVAKDFVPWFFGEGYEKVVSLLFVFAPLVTIIAISNCLDWQCLTPVGKRVQVLGALWGGAVLNVILNLILIPSLASVGAAIGSVFAELFIAIVFMILAKKYISVGKVLGEIWKYLLAGILMFGVVFAISLVREPSFVTLLIEVLSGAAIYVATILILRDSMVFEYIDVFKKKLLKKHR